MVRAAAVLFLVWHVLTVGGSIARDTPPGAFVRKHLTGTIERTLGIYQTWSMFVPNAPRSSTWLVATGRTADGEEHPVAVLGGDLPPDRIEWFYRRGGKFERNATSKSKGSMRKTWAWWACEREEAAGRPYKSIMLQRAERRTPPPSEAGQKPRSDWRVKTTDLSRRNCR